jgi:hypothetical protein
MQIILTTEEQKQFENYSAAMERGRANVTSDLAIIEECNAVHRANPLGVAIWTKLENLKIAGLDIQVARGE